MREDSPSLQPANPARRMRVMEQRFAIVAKYGVAATLVTALAIGGLLWASAQIERTKVNLQRAELAEADAVARVHEAKLNWVRANRLTGRPGQRFASPGRVDPYGRRHQPSRLAQRGHRLLSLPDLRLLKRWARTSNWESLNLSPSFRLYSSLDDHGNLIVRDVLTDVVQYQLPNQGAKFLDAIGSPDECFVATSDVVGRAHLWDLRTRTSAPDRLPAWRKASRLYARWSRTGGETQRGFIASAQLHQRLGTKLYSRSRQRWFCWN